eukprot:GILJ01004666.1.p1 GENE.GILJ01004666.1~~GILJ01004666.1.p1  ORF type:complete len:580 (+),score=69.18 GILJ01004666.1:75-1742(+)
MAQLCGVFALLLCLSTMHIEQVYTATLISLPLERNLDVDGARHLLGDESMYGGIYLKQYYAKIRLGKQNFTVTVDTGSALLSVPSVDCAQARLDGKTLYVKNSTTSALVPYSSEECKTGRRAPLSANNCGFRIEYLDTSFIEGVLVEETLSFGSMTSRILFGASQTQSVNFVPSGIDGIIGLGPADLQSTVLPPLDHFVRANLMPDVFSLCSGYIDGHLVLGGIDQSMYNTSVKWTPIVNRIHYGVQISAMSVAGRTFDLSADKYLGGHNFGAIVDSGTTNLILPVAVFNAWKAAVQTEYCNGNSTLPYLCGASAAIFRSPSVALTMTAEDVAKYPPITFHLASASVLGEDVTLTLGPEYWLLNCTSTSVNCYRSGVGNASFSSADIMLGDVFMRAFYTIFDKQNGRIGFADRTSCQSKGGPLSVVVDVDQTMLIIRIASSVVVFLITLGTIRIIHDPIHLRTCRDFSRLMCCQSEFGHARPAVAVAITGTYSQGRPAGDHQISLMLASTVDPKSDIKSSQPGFLIPLPDLTPRTDVGSPSSMLSDITPTASPMN